MTLGIAMLISCFNDQSMFNEIKELIEEKDISILKSFSCQCPEHQHTLNPPCPGCSTHSTHVSNRDSPVSTSSTASHKSYSFFSDNNSIEEILCGKSSAKSSSDIVKPLNVLLDMVENATNRFQESYVFKMDEIIIMHENRDILDLGDNIVKPFPLCHPVMPASAETEIDETAIIRVKCSDHDCDFHMFVTENELFNMTEAGTGVSIVDALKRQLQIV